MCTHTPRREQTETQAAAGKKREMPTTYRPARAGMRNKVAHRVQAALGLSDPLDIPWNIKIYFSLATYNIFNAFPRAPFGATHQSCWISASPYGVHERNFHKNYSEQLQNCTLHIKRGAVRTSPVCASYGVYEPSKI